MELIKEIHAACNPAIGCISPPVDGGMTNGIPTGLITLANSLLRLVFVIAGLWALVNFILAGFAFLSASGDPKKITLAWQKIWMTALGLVVVLASFLLAAIIGMVLWGDPFAILNPKL